jgi:NADH:ubiquinone oxidoreductase subunit D
MLTENRIWKQRLVDIGVVSLDDAMAWDLAVLCYVVQV